MGLFGEVKCARCDRRYSSLRRRCPYCGARRRTGGKYSGRSDNRQQIIIGAALLIVIIAAVIFLVYRNVGAGSAKATPTPVSSAKVSGTPQTSGTPSPGTSPTVTPTPGVKTVTSIVLSRQDFTLSNIGETWQLTATLTPANSGQTVTWTSQDPKVATVGTDGRVTAVAAGMTTVTAEAGGSKADCVVRVTGSGTVAPADGLSLSHYDVTLSASKKETFHLTASGASSAPSYSSANAGIASVDANGWVTAVAAGSTVIYVSVDGKKLECLVRVS